MSPTAGGSSNATTAPTAAPAASASAAGAAPSHNGAQLQGPAGASKKRRASGSGSRGVANLTPEQLAKKRANDREAQRAIRERTKNQIETLEARIRELTSQQPYQELQQIIRQKNLAEAENADIKKRLMAVLNIVQPLLGVEGLDGSKHLSLFAFPMLHCEASVLTHELARYRDVANHR